MAVTFRIVKTWRRRIGLFVTAIAIGVASTACSTTPPRDALWTKLEKRNGLTEVQAHCVAVGLYDGMPDAQPAIRRLTPAELRAVAKPDNAGKVSADVMQIMRDVVTNCVPTTTAPGA